MLTKHSAVREKADTAYRKNAEKMWHKYSKERRIREFTAGENVSVRIPRIDWACTDPQRLPCVVVEVVGKAVIMYRLRCESGVLKCCYRASDLEPYAGSYNIPTNNWEEQPRVTLREAARNQAQWNVFQGNKCNCRPRRPGTCDSRRCPCRKKGIDCSSHCHRGEDCTNKVYDSKSGGSDGSDGSSGQSGGRSKSGGSDSQPGGRSKSGGSDGSSGQSGGRSKSGGSDSQPGERSKSGGSDSQPGGRSKSGGSDGQPGGRSKSGGSDGSDDQPGDQSGGRSKSDGCGGQPGDQSGERNKSDGSDGQSSGRNKSDGRSHSSDEPCMCRTRCNSKKRCSCKAYGKPCVPGCHPGHTCSKHRVQADM